MKNNRDIGLTGDSHGAGKGDSSRITDTKAFRQNFDQVNFFDVNSKLFRRVGTKLVRTYPK